MRVRRRTLGPAATLAVAIGLTSGAIAGPMEDGWAALQAGNVRDALVAWIPLAQAGDADALYALGWAFQHGQGPLADRPLARRYYRAAAGRGHADAAFALGLMWRQGIGGEADYAQALGWFERAGTFARDAGGHAQAEYAAGLQYFRGLGVARDFEAAIRWLKLAARHDHPAAQFMLASMYEAGWGTERDRALAWYWYSLSARHPAAERAKYGTSITPEAALANLEPTMREMDWRRARAMLDAVTPPGR